MNCPYNVVWTCLSGPPFGGTRLSGPLLGGTCLSRPLLGGTCLSRPLRDVGSSIVIPRARQACPSGRSLGGTCL